jgi:trehalose-6-phosphate synthase
MKDFIVTNRGPAKKDSGGLIQIFKKLQTDISTSWFSPVSNTKQHTIDLFSSINNGLEHSYITCPNDMIKKQYLLLANSLIWPVLHEIEDVWMKFMSENENILNEIWDNYIRFLSFMEFKLSNSSEVRNLWVCDYQVLGLNLANVKNNKVFTFFTPFPNLETIKNGGGIIIKYFSLLFIYNRITFQTEIDKNNYIEFKKYLNSNKKQDLVISPLGENRMQFNFLEKLDSGKDLILFVSRIEYTKGIRQALGIVDCFLDNYSHTNTIFEFILEPSRKYIVVNLILIQTQKTKLELNSS